MSQKHEISNATLVFSGRVVHTDRRRRELAKRLTADGVTWLRLAKPLPPTDEHGDPTDVVKLAHSIREARLEANAAKWLESRGMLMRHESDPTAVMWSYLHERPRFGIERDTHVMHGLRIPSLSPDQKMMLTLTRVAHGRREPHRVLALKAPKLQRTVRSLERRKLVKVARDVSGVWSLTLGDAILEAMTAEHNARASQTVNQNTPPAPPSA